MSKPQWSRLAEPSTWAGITALAGIFGLPIAPEYAQPIMQAGIGISGLLSIFLSEKSG